MRETSARLLRLLTLMQVRRTWSGPEIADRLGVSTRTVRRDMEKLRSLDYPVTGDKGVAGGYRMAAGARMPPLQLDDEEAVALAITLRTAAASGVTGIGETALRALVKLEQVLPPRLRNRVKTLQLSTVETPGRGQTVDAEVLTTIAMACRDRIALSLDYSGLGGSTRSCTVEPHELITWGSRWYLAAWEIERHDWAAFPVDRIRVRGHTGTRFSTRPLPAGGAAAHVARSVARMWPDQAAIRLQAAETSRRRSPAS